MSLTFVLTPMDSNLLYYHVLFNQKCKPGRPDDVYDGEICEQP